MVIKMEIKKEIELIKSELLKLARDLECYPAGTDRFLEIGMEMRNLAHRILRLNREANV